MARGHDEAWPSRPPRSGPFPAGWAAGGTRFVASAAPEIENDTAAGIHRMRPSECRPEDTRRYLIASMPTRRTKHPAPRTSPTSRPPPSSGNDFVPFRKNDSAISPFAPARLCGRSPLLCSLCSFVATLRIRKRLAAKERKDHKRRYTRTGMSRQTDLTLRRPARTVLLRAG